MAAASQRYSVAAYKGSAVILKDDNTGLRITFDRTRELMLVDYPNHSFSELFPSGISELTILHLRLLPQSTDDRGRHHARLALANAKATNNNLRAIIAQFIEVGVLRNDAYEALHHCLLNEEGKHPSSSPSLSG